MKVKAKRLGWYGLRRVKEGQVFELKDLKHFSPLWMEDLVAAAKAKADAAAKAEAEGKAKGKGKGKGKAKVDAGGESEAEGGSEDAALDGEDSQDVSGSRRGDQDVI